MGVEPYNFVSSLNCVLAQRLIRMLCPYCKRHYQPTDVELSESGLVPDQYRQRTFYLNVGCDACNHTGYRGRTAIHELLDLSDNIREMIVERRPGSEVRRAAEAEGLTKGTRPEASDSMATRRQGQCVICASRKTSRRVPRISGRSGSAKRTATASPVASARPRGDMN